VAAIVVLGMLVSSGAALAQTEACGGPKAKITKKVDKPLGEAQKARDAKNWEEVLVKVAEAEAVPVDKTDYDRYWMTEFKGIAHANLKAFPEALAELEAGLNSPCMPEDGKPLRSKVLMQLAYQGKNYAKAVEYGKLAVKLNPSDVEMVNYLGNAYFQMDDNQNARVTMTDYVTKMEAAGKVPGGAGLSHPADRLSAPQGRQLRHGADREAGRELSEARLLDGSHQLAAAHQQERQRAAQHPAPWPTARRS
jgi:tetratricopeptide (TPR) repeat protein